MVNRMLCVAFGWNDSQCAFISNLLPDFCVAICFVGNNSQWWNFPIKEGIHHLAVMKLATADFQPKRATFGVYCCVNLTCATAA
jgi:hypothetical protein